MTGTNSYEGMIAETVPLVGHGRDRVLAYFARPIGVGPFPAVVLFHHRPGWDEWYREATRRFAHHGYLALSHDLYSRVGDGEPDDVAAMARAQSRPTDIEAVADGQAAIAYLRSLPNSTGRVGLFGTCSGARHAFLTAVRTPDVQAVVDCWGGGIVAGPDELTEAEPVAPIDLASQLPCPLLGLYGNDDRRPSPAHVDALEAELRQHGKDVEMHRYDGAGHGFFYYDRPAAYRAGPAVEGWQLIWRFLDRTLRHP